MVGEKDEEEEDEVVEPERIGTDKPRGTVGHGTEDQDQDGHIPFQKILSAHCAPRCIVLCCVVSYCVVSYRIVLCCIVLYCIVV